MKKIFGRESRAKADAKAVGEQDRELKGQVLLVNKHPVTVEGRIAEGGFAIVYLVRSNVSNKLLALKRQFVNDPKQLEACKREIQIIERLSSHKNIVKYVDSSIVPAGDGVYECMLLTKFYKHNVLGLMNEKLTRGKWLHEEEVLNIFCDVVEAVSRLHHCQTPIIHRDLKIENVLIDGESQPRTHVLCDFGSATNKIYTSDTYPIGLVEEEITKYTTLSYRAPEMIDLYGGKPITTKSDVWALGVMLYKLCFFALPFGDSPLAIQNGSNFTFPENSEYSVGLLGLIRYMLEPDPDVRPDVYQVAIVAFALAGRKCSVGNLNNSQAPSLDEIRQLKAIHDARQISAAARLPSPSAQMNEGGANSQQSGNLRTSVAPRQRPKGGAYQQLGVLSLGSGGQLQPWKQNKTESAMAAPQTTSGSRPPVWKVSESASNPDLLASPAQTSFAASGSDAAAAFSTDVGQFPPPSVLPSSVSAHKLATASHDLLESSVAAGNGRGARAAVSGQVVQPGGGAHQTTHSHRRNVSDTSTINVRSGNHPSAFKPYRSSELDTSFSGDESKNPPTMSADRDVLVDVADAPSWGAHSHSANASPGSMAQLLAQQQQDVRTLSNPELMPPPAVLLSTWKPFEQPVQKSAFAFPPAREELDDTRFGASFDKLPRRGSQSSIKNVKSRESLVMDDVDPFGAAPFRPPSGSVKSKHSSSSGNASAATVVGGKTRATPTSRSSGKREKRTTPPQTGSKLQLPKISTPQPAADLAASLKAHQLSKYRKLVHSGSDDEGEGAGRAATNASGHRKTKQHASGGAKTADRDGDNDSVGSASDLQARMQVTTSDEETDVARAATAGVQQRLREQSVQHNRALSDSSFERTPPPTVPTLSTAAEQLESSPADHFGYEYLTGGGTAESSGGNSKASDDRPFDFAAATTALQLGGGDDSQQDSLLYPDNDYVIERLGAKPLLFDDAEEDADSDEETTGRAVATADEDTTSAKTPSSSLNFELRDFAAGDAATALSTSQSCTFPDGAIRAGAVEVVENCVFVNAPLTKRTDAASGGSQYSLGADAQLAYRTAAASSLHNRSSASLEEFPAGGAMDVFGLAPFGLRTAGGKIALPPPPARNSDDAANGRLAAPTGGASVTTIYCHKQEFSAANSVTPPQQLLGGVPAAPPTRALVGAETKPVLLPKPTHLVHMPARGNPPVSAQTNSGNIALYVSNPVYAVSPAVQGEPRFAVVSTTLPSAPSQRNEQLLGRASLSRGKAGGVETTARRPVKLLSQQHSSASNAGAAKSKKSTSKLLHKKSGSSDDVDEISFVNTSFQNE